MNTKQRVCLFGFVAGLIWSIAPGILFEGFRSIQVAIMTAVASIITGLLVSILLASPLKKFGVWAGYIFGGLSLPLGAFLFGFFYSIAHFYFDKVDGSGWNAVECGFYFAVYSIFTICVFFLLPAAITTTFLFRRFLLHGRLLYKG